MTSCTPVKLAFSYVEPEGMDSEEPPIIFCHGLTATKEHWETYDIPKIAADATKRKVYAIDARNHGDTEWSDVFNFDANVDDLLHFMDTIGAKTATIVGHSMGGITAMRTALRVPERITGIFVEDMACGKIPEEIYGMIETFFKQGIAALDQLTTEAGEEEAKELIFETLLQSVSPEMAAVLRTQSKEAMGHIRFRRLEDGRLALKGNVEVIRKAIKNPDDLLPEYEGTYEGPACFIYGKISPFKIAGEEEGIKRHFPNAELVPVENATHHVHGDCTEEFIETLLKFLLK